MLRIIPSLWLFLRYVRALIATRRAAPGDDLLSALVQAEEAGAQLSDDELVAMVFVLPYRRPRDDREPDRQRRPWGLLTHPTSWPGRAPTWRSSSRPSRSCCAFHEPGHDRHGATPART
ncbi:MAG: hypothetical protein U0470_00095 [Anaerolineae bacterium]